MKSVLSLAVAFIVCAVISQSFTAVGSSPRNSLAIENSRSFKTVNDTLKETSVQERLEKEKSLWSEGKRTDCENMLIEDWEFYAPKTSPADRELFCQKAALIANLRMELASYKNAKECYEIVLEQDRFNHPDSARLASDYNNIGVCNQMLVASSDDLATKQAAFDAAIKNFRQSEKLLRRLNDKEALFTCLSNQYALFHDVHNKSAATHVFAALKQLDHSRYKDFRELVIEQQ